MIHDPVLIEQLSALKREAFHGIVYRAARENQDPLTPSIYGGRWAPMVTDRFQVPALYTSLEREGALAEITHHWSQLTPLPSKPVLIHQIEVETGNVIAINEPTLESLGISAALYRDGARTKTQQIGAVAEFLGCDAILVPSARWQSRNLVVFTSNHKLTNAMRVVSNEIVDWQAWARSVGLL